MRLTRLIALTAPVIVCAALASAAHAAVQTSGTLVSVASPPSPFSQNKQNEPAVAIDAHDPAVVAAGANDEIDEEGCNAGDPTTCPFTPGVGVSGIYFNLDGGGWAQPTYTGYSARNCVGPAACTPQTSGPIGTLPHYVENGLVSDGDPALAFGPRPGAGGTFSWGNGSRLYYANLTSNFPSTSTFKGFEAIAVSRTDDVRSAASGNAAAWMDPVLISKQSSTTFADKEQVWADNASSSRFFGNVYVCWAMFKSNSRGNAFPTPLNVATSTDGGTTWTVRQVGPATDNGLNSQPDGCTVRTDSTGNVYVFGIATRLGTEFATMYKSVDGGAHFGPLHAVAKVVSPGVFDPVVGRPVMDGVVGARVDLAAAPSVDIANGAPTGADATDRIVLTWADGAGGLNNEKLMVTTSTNGGGTWSAPAAIPLTTGDRPFYTAPAISPNGTDAYITYNAFTAAYQTDETNPRGLVGVMLHADVSSSGVGAWSELARGVEGDARGTSQNNLAGEFLGDYVYTAATRAGAVGLWNDARSAPDCPAVDAWRESLSVGSPIARPQPGNQCTDFGNSDIFGATVSDPTP